MSLDGDRIEELLAENKRLREAPFALTQFQQQVARDALLKHRETDHSFCSGYEKEGCKFRVPFGSTPQMRAAQAQHQIEEIIKALQEIA